MCDLNTNTFLLALILRFLVNLRQIYCDEMLLSVFEAAFITGQQNFVYTASLLCVGNAKFFPFYFKFILVMSFALVADSRIWPAGIYFGLYLCVFFLYINFLYNRPLWAYPTQLDKLRETLTVIDTVFLFNALEQYMAAVSTSCKAKCKPRGKSWVSEKQKCIHVPYAFDAAPRFSF